MMKRGRECPGVGDQDKVLYMSPGRLEWIERKGAWWTGSMGRIFYVRGCCIIIFFFWSLSRKFFGPVQWPVQGKLSDANGRRASFGGFSCAFPQMRHNFLCMNCAGRPHQQR
ncbi:hypothetical protein BO79DRAFT_15820 [Aspergillus costaricaensis CBS 115574]|uniref:Uncharacterized protein n=1 Tax=Aspergillus costaricaensis CBS 115574 TaxID=1448317 RepID=A0ACD1IFE8_9EURO|nr:hypothetical protein BO79DRAFT_15820 [Aspergillus costaricaensis CBS 115574]RAK89006.1 hypothetical protein BO79DRAFT_15820 [Aspergillus costaricaensis CBS 115574]